MSTHPGPRIAIRGRGPVGAAAAAITALHGELE